MKNSSTGNKTFIAICGSINFSSYFHPTEKRTEDYIVLDFPEGQTETEAWSNYEDCLKTFYHKDHIEDIINTSILYPLTTPTSYPHPSILKRPSAEDIELPF